MGDGTRTKDVYRITVAGELDDSWCQLVGSTSLELVQREGSPPVTVLEVPVTDRSALSGVLDTLYELHLPVMSVELVQR
jgi:hypothetical protein